MPLSHYDVLGVARDATAAEIKAAHRRLAREHHPDQGGDKATFQAIQAAYDTLKDDDKRAHYDRTGENATAARSELAEIVPFVVGAFDRAVDRARNGDGWGSPKGLGRTAMVSLMVLILREDKKKGETANKTLELGRADLEEMQRRLGVTGDGENVIGSMLAGRLRDNAEQQARNTATLALLDRTIEHVRQYGWELDPTPEVKVDFSTVSSTADWIMSFGYADSLRAKPARRSFIYDERDAYPVTTAPLRFTKAAKHRRAKMDAATNLYVRSHTVTLDPETGKQVPAARGSWRELERQVSRYDCSRYHSGGTVRLHPDEIPAILNRGFDVLRRTAA